MVRFENHPRMYRVQCTRQHFSEVDSAGGFLQYPLEGQWLARATQQVEEALKLRVSHCPLVSFVLTPAFLAFHIQVCSLSPRLHSALHFRDSLGHLQASSQPDPGTQLSWGMELSSITLEATHDLLCPQMLRWPLSTVDPVSFLTPPASSWSQSRPTLAHIVTHVLRKQYPFWENLIASCWMILIIHWFC